MCVSTEHRSCYLLFEPDWKCLHASLSLSKSIKFFRKSFLLRFQFQPSNPQHTMKTISWISSTEYALFCVGFPMICASLCQCLRRTDDRMRRDALCRTYFWARVNVVWMWFFTWILVTARFGIGTKQPTRRPNISHSISFSGMFRLSLALHVLWALSANYISFDSICIYFICALYINKPAIAIPYSTLGGMRRSNCIRWKYFSWLVAELLAVVAFGWNQHLRYTSFDFVECHIW